MFTLYYRCLYRDYWYEGDTFYDWPQAVYAAQFVRQQRGTPVILKDAYEQVVYSI